MNTQAYINITLQTFGGLISLMIIIFVKYVRLEQSPLDRLYLRFLVCNTALLFSNVLSWYFDKSPGTSGLILLFAVNLVMYLLHYLLLGTMTEYLAALLEEWGAPCKYLTRVVWGLALLGGLMVIISQFNGMYYFFDEQNVYQRGPWFLLFPIIGIIGAAVDLILLLSRYGQLRSKEYRTFLLLLVLAILALVVQAIFYGAVYLYITTTFVAISIYVFIQGEQVRRLSQQTLALERSRTAVMLSQIQPHFLYNALQGIKLLCDTDPPRASEALEHFSFYLRGNLDALVDAQLAPFSKELVHIQDYLYLEKMRFSEKLNIEWSLTCEDFVLPPLTVQPLIENAIRHGINKKKGGGTLTIRSERTSGGVIVTIQDDGVGFDPEEHKDDGRTHIGIQNTRDRLNVLCGGSLSIESTKGIGTTAKIFLPQREAIE